MQISENSGQWLDLPANIAEGCRKRTKAGKARFFNIAQGSLEETRYHLILALDLSSGNPAAQQYQAEGVSKPLDAYLNGVLSSVP